MVAAVNGMVVLTLSVSFALNIIRSTTTARHWAVRYHAAQRASDEDWQEELKQLGPDLCGIVVDLTASPLTRIFIPDDPEMSFPEAIRDLIESLDDRALLPSRSSQPKPDMPQLMLGIELLGRHASKARADTDIEAARAWADTYSV